MKSNDHDIIARILAGDVYYFRELMERYSSRVFSLVVRIVDNGCDAEEIVQDVFVKAYRNLSGFDSRSSFSTWLYRIACNEAVSHARRSKHRDMVVDTDRLAVLCDSDVDVFFNSDDERLAALPDAIDRLTPDERALITLFYYDGLPIGEAADILGISVSNAKVRLMRTRRKLYVMITEISRVI